MVDLVDPMDVVFLVGQITIITKLLSYIVTRSKNTLSGLVKVAEI